VLSGLLLIQVRHLGVNQSAVQFLGVSPQIRKVGLQHLLSRSFCFASSFVSLFVSVFNARHRREVDSVFRAGGKAAMTIARTVVSL
jgi:hypothetical protein